MMLAWLGREHDDEAARRAGAWIDAAVTNALADGSALTPDLGGSAGTTAAGDAVLLALDEAAASS